MHVPLRYPHEQSGSSEVTIRPGEFYFGRGTHKVRTLLGSCVAITLWNHRAQIGGMCHYLLPSRGQSAQVPTQMRPALDGRYADEAMALFMQGIHSAFTVAADYEAKIFGGGNQFRGTSSAGGIDVPERNIQAARSLLHHHGLNVVNTDVGSHGARNLVMDLSDGEVWVKRNRLIDEKVRP